MKNKAGRYFRSILSLTLVLAVAFFVLGPVESAQAGELKGYEALLVTMTGTGSLKMTPGEVKTVTVTFQNIGSKDWFNDGTGYISIYTYEPKYRRSDFDPGNWEWSDHPTRIQETQVPVGGVGTIKFDLHAPTTEGTWEEHFHLASEDTAWIPGGDFVFKISVAEDNAVVADEVEVEEEVVQLVNGYGAAVVSSSSESYTASPGQVISYTVGLKNIGTKSWYKRYLHLPEVQIAAANTVSPVFHSSWLTSSIPLARSGEVAPGSTDTLSFKFSAPATAGSHTVKFQLVADGVSVPGAEIDIPVEVTGGSAEAIDDPLREGIDYAELIEEPIIRVGTMIVDEETDWEVVITSAESDLELRDDQGALLAQVDQGEEILAYYDDGRYYYDVGRGLEKSSYPLRFIPVEENAVLEVTNFDRQVTRSSAYTDNTFRNILELRYNEVKDRTWLINELPMEYYLRGLAETSNYSHLEFQKALITAARTYAFYHWQRYTKHDDEGYHVDAYWDQVYKGYGNEERTPRLTEAVQETEGIIVEYEGETAITSYFSRSDGRTRDWSEVWYGEVAWAKSVAVPCDVGKTLWGHGVGMSASGALCMAEDGDSFDYILKYFYQDIDLVERW